MPISAISSNAVLTSALKADGLSADKIKTVETDLQQVEKASGASGAAGVNGAGVRAALEKKIDDDVKSGKLSKEDATAISKALDDMDGSAAQTAATAKAPPGGGAHGGGHGGGGGGGGDGGSAAKTVQSETETITGATLTTVTTYTDGTTTTTNTVATEQDIAKYGKASSPEAASAAATKDAASDYLATIEPGSLIDQAA